MVFSITGWWLLEVIARASAGEFLSMAWKGDKPPADKQYAAIVDQFPGHLMPPLACSPSFNMRLRHRGLSTSVPRA
jgi:hypothetical protein